jgi:hypothetical protein
LEVLLLPLLLVSGGMVLLPPEVLLESGEVLLPPEVLLESGEVLLPPEVLESGGVVLLLPLEELLELSLEPDDPLVPAGGALSVVPPVAPGVVLSVAPGVLLEVPPVLSGEVPVAPGVVLSVVLPGLLVDPLMLPDEEEGLSLLLVPAVLPVVPELLVPLSAPWSQAAKAKDATNALSNTEYFMVFPLKRYCCRTYLDWMKAAKLKCLTKD